MHCYKQKIRNSNFRTRTDILDYEIQIPPFSAKDDTEHPEIFKDGIRTVTGARNNYILNECVWHGMEGNQETNSVKPITVNNRSL